MTIDKILTDEQIDKLNETQLKEYISKYNKEIARRLVEIQTQLQEEDKELARIGTDFLTKNHELDNLRSQLKLLADTLRHEKGSIEGLKSYKKKYIDATRRDLIKYGVAGGIDIGKLPDNLFWKLRKLFEYLMDQGYDSEEAYYETFISLEDEVNEIITAAADNPDFDIDRAINQSVGKTMRIRGSI